MRWKRLIWMWAIVATVGSCSTEQGSSVDTPELDEVFREINQEVLQRSKAYPTLKTAIETIGHRLTGSENGARAEKFAHDLLREYGFENVRYFPFKVEAWSRDKVSLWVKSESEEGYWDVPTVSLAQTPVEARVEAKLVDVGNGLRKHFEAQKEKVDGNIVLLNLRLDKSDSTEKNLHRTEKAALAMEYGAVGAVFVNSVDGNVLLTGAASATGELIDLPAICVGKEDGAEIRAEMGEGKEMIANIAMLNRSDEISARNVIASVEGRELPNERILIGGHLDSWDLATGAIDNGIGSFTILEIARVFKKLDLRPRRSIDFVMFMGEEQGLLGSRALVADMKAKSQLGEIRYVMNLDMSGNTDGFGVFGRQEMVDFVKSTGEKITQIDSVFDNKISEGVGLHSDHQPFLLEGIPIMGIVSDLNPYVYRFYHSDGDDFHLVKKEDMDNGARFTAMMLYALADAEELPAQRMSSEETREFLVEKQLKEKLELGGQWRWE